MRGALLALLCACTPVKREALVIARVNIPTMALTHVAEDRGYFDAEHVDVQFKNYPAGALALAATLAGEADLATVYDTPTVIATLEGKDIAALTTLHTARGLTALVGRKSKGVRSLPDLAKKRVGVARRTSADFVLSVLLATGGVDEGAVTFVDGTQPELQAALEKGEIDAAVFWSPFLFEIEERLAEDATTLELAGYTELSVLAGERARLDAKRAAITAVLRALHRAEIALNAEPTLAERTVRAHFPTMSPVAVRKTVAGTRYELGLSTLLLAVLRQQASWLERTGTPRAPHASLYKVLTPSYLEPVVREAVTVLRDAGGPQ